MNILPPPGPARTRQLVLLGALVIAAAYVVSRVFGSGPAGAPVSASNLPVRTTVNAAPITTMPQPVQLDKLGPAPNAPETTRNPFRFGTKPLPPAPPAPPTRPPSLPTQPPGPPPAPAVPAIPLKFIGRIVMPDKRVVASLTYSDGRGEVVRGLEGQIVDGRYRILRIGEESLVIEYVNGTGRTTLPLRGS